MTTWTAPFIAPSRDLGSAPLLRREFRLDEGHGRVSAARLESTAIGLVDSWLNSRRVTDDVLNPGWTSYEWRQRVVSYDVTDHLTSVAPGDTTVLALILGNGWALGRLGWTGSNHSYGDERAAFAELTVVFEDGHQQRILTDTDWYALPTSILTDDLYDGQKIDARRRDNTRLKPWHATVPADAVGVHKIPFDHTRLVPNAAPPVQATGHRAIEHVWTSPSGATLIDFGQNLVGWIRVSVPAGIAAAGTTITIRHAEVLENGELGVRPLRSAKATDQYTLSGDADTFEPRFTFHGFRYAEVTGWPGSSEDLRAALTAVVVGSALQRTGTFRSSHELLNRFHDNVVWGMRGNFLSVPTDCPQRDERLGWTGDIAAFAPTSTFLFDTQTFLRDWLRDVALEQQHADGVIPFVVPDVLKHIPNPDESAVGSTALWSDAGVWVPWTLYERYGDIGVLEEQWDSMTAHITAVERLLSPSGLWDSGFQFGDWLDPDAPPDDPAAAKADPGVIATLCAFRSANLVADTANILGHDPAPFRAVASRLRDAFHTHYLADDGSIRSDAPTVYTLAIVFGILDAHHRELAGARLAALTAANGYRISTGFVGTPFIADALTSTGHIGDAYRLLLQTENPSWLYPVTMGATTIWERWDSMLPDGSINPGEMTSFNHYALGAVADWVHRTVGGIAPLTPGYQEILVAPQPGGGITWAETSLETGFGIVAVRWSLDSGTLRLHVDVPPGTTAVVRLPGQDGQRLPSGTHEISATAKVGAGVG